jgi:hypothetical protein
MTIETKNLNKKSYKMLEIYPLHIKHSGLFIPVQDLDFSQQFEPSYRKEEVYGRMDPIVTYSSTKRSMRISFVCQAHHFIDGTTGVVDNIQTINLLTQMLYPAYERTSEKSPKSLLKAPPFFKIAYGNYFGDFDHLGLQEGGITGIITGFSHGVGKVARNYAFGEDSMGDHYVLPREVKVGFSFEVIHNREVGWRDRAGKSHFSLDGYGSNFPYNGLSNSFLEGPEKPVEAPTEPTAKTQTPLPTKKTSARKFVMKDGICLEKKSPLDRGSQVHKSRCK